MDQEWIEGILKKDERVILTFIETHQDQVFNQAYRMLGSVQDAEEACQDVFMKVLRKISNFKGESKLSTWIYRICFTTCQDVLKKRKRRPVFEEIDQKQISSWTTIHDSLQQLEQSEQRLIIDSSLKNMDPTDAVLIDYYHLQELSIYEIANITGKTKSAIKVRLMRARKKLLVHLEKLLPTETVKYYRHEK